LNRTAQEQIFDVFHFSLRPGGLLFIGGSETGGNVQSLFSPVDAKHRIFVRRSVPRPSWRIPTLLGNGDILVTRASASTRPRTLPPLTRSGVEEAVSETAESHQAGQERRATLFGELHLKLLEEYGPPSAVVNEALDILHLSAKAGRYLQFAGGEPTANFLRVVHPGLRIELRTALFRAGQTQETTVTAPQTIDIEGKHEAIVAEVRPMRATDAATGFFLILFHKQTDAPEAPAQPALPELITRSLEEEVEFLKEQLNATVEQYETSNEELKASNEEMQAVNEEMRSATEELETSKEELQSVNEELTTVNHELKNSVEELSRANTDLDNLMASTEIGTIFLDRQLRIQRFTPSAQKIFNLLPADVGRPLADITSKLVYAEFIQEAESVLDNLAMIEREVRVGETSWYVVRMAPYRTAEDRIAGVVATFIETTQRKHAEEQLRESEARLRKALDIDTVGVMFFNVDGQITDANKAFLRLSGYTREDLQNGRLRWEGLPAPEYMDRSREALDEFKRSGKTGTYEKQYLRKDGTRWWGLFSTSALSEDVGVKYVIDITARKEAERALSESEERFRQFAENSGDVFWIVDAESRELEYINPVYERLFGEPREALLCDVNHRIELIHPADRERASQNIARVLAGERFVIEYRIIRQNDGVVRWMRTTAFPIPDASGRVRRAAGVTQDVTTDKESAEGTRVAEERFRLLVEGARDYAMFLLDPENRVTFWSQGAERVFGWSQEEAVGKIASFIFTPEDKKRGAVEEEIGNAVKEGRALDKRWHLRKDGSRFWSDGVLMRLDDGDSLRGFAKIARDATDERNAEDALRHARDEMEQRVLERTRDLMSTNVELERTMAQRQQLERELLEISEREKRRIGEDLHDMVCQELSATALFLKSSAKKLETENPSASGTLERAAETVNRNVGIARDLARGLQAVELTASGLKNALRDLAAQACDNSGIKCHFKCARGVRVPDDTVALHLYRIAQEALTNAVKHSGANNILITLDRNSTHVCVSVQDDGKGFVIRARRKGLGLHMMRYRANALGGELKIERRRSGGMDITCVIPSKH
jgi:PAS domain S-box-containing protein